MKNYEISSLKNNGFNNRPQLQNVYNNNYKNRIPYSHQQRMMSSQELNKESGQDKEKIDNNIEQKQKNDLRDIIEKKENNYFLDEEKKK